MSLTVIKLGGSLMGSEELPLWLNAIEAASKKSTIIIVPGGGEFANSIRSLQCRYQFTDRTAHNMALHSMCQFGFLLKEINQKLNIINDIKDDAKLDEYPKAPMLWLPHNIIVEKSEIKPSWDFTSDSISLWLAIKLAAKKLILVKSKTISSNKSGLINHIKNGDIDKEFQLLMNKFEGEISFFNKTEFELFH